MFRIACQFLKGTQFNGDVCSYLLEALFRICLLFRVGLPVFYLEYHPKFIIAC